MVAAEPEPRVSVVINTLNRASSLRKTLRALEHLHHPSFEVVVIDGPSTDDTALVLAERAGRIKVGRCPEPNLAMSRNLGIASAAGELVAFIDDDAIPDPRWLDDLVRGFEADDDVACVGGPVFDHTGAVLQVRYSLADRLGDVWTSDGPNPTDWLSSPLTPFYPYAVGTNACFRRDRLLEIGGFDEEYEYYLDETDVALRMIEAGYSVVALDVGLVYHKFLPSHVRNERRVATNRFALLKNRRYFGLRHGPGFYTDAEIGRSYKSFVDLHRADVSMHIDQGSLAPEAMERFEADAASAPRAAESAAVRGPRTRRPEWFAKDDRGFVPFSTRRPPGGRLHICLVSQEYLPRQLNGIARVLHTLATELGARGHVVRMITEGQGHSTVDLEGDVWVHRIVPTGDPTLAGQRTIPTEIWRLPAAVLEEVRRIDSIAPVDVVQIPNWGSEGAAVVASGEFPTVMGLYTPFLTVAELDHRLGAEHPHNRARLELERDGYHHATAVLACGPSIIEEIQTKYGIDFEDGRVGYVPHGLPEVVAEPVGHAGGPVVLFVGRLEPRKGIDTLLEAIPGVLRQVRDAHVVIAGDATIASPGGETYADRFLRDPRSGDIRERVRFLGVVDDDALTRLYAACDVVVVPSRYESFGLIAIEAMRAGKPVIAAAVGGLAEIVVDGETGLLIPPGDAAALQRALLDALSIDRETMAKAARDRYERCYTAERMAAGVEAFYRHVVALPHHRAAPLQLQADAVVGAGWLELLRCPSCHGRLRPIIEAICVDGRVKDGALACKACDEVVATVADFRVDFLGPHRVMPDDPPTPLVLPVLGEWRVAPARPELDIDGAWMASPPYLASDGSAGDRLSFTSRFTDLVARCARTPEGGRLAVFVDGERKHTIDLADAEASHVVGVPLVTNAPDRLHTVELLALGGDGNGSRSGQVLVEELIVRGPIEADRPFGVPTPINRGNAYSPTLEALLARLESGAPVLEIGGGDRRRAVAGHLNVEYLPFELADMYADIHHLPFRDEAFELVCSQAVFEHVARPFDAARELVRVTRPGGLIFTEVAFLQPVHAVPHHYFNMTAAGVRELFHDCEVIDEGWFGPLSSTVEWLVQAAGLGGKVRASRLRKIVSDLRQLDPLVSEAGLRAIASGVHVTVRTPQR